MVSKIIFNLNYQIMEKEPVSVLILFLSNGTRNTGNHIEKRGYYLKNLFSSFLTI